MSKMGESDKDKNVTSYHLCCMPFSSRILNPVALHGKQWSLARGSCLWCISFSACGDPGDKNLLCPATLW